MAFKYIALFALVATAAAVVPQYQGQHEIHEAPAEYEFAYSVHDAHTGDIKEQQETRHGDNVQGHYSLVEPDGHRRIVHYTADKHSGFVAKVEREPTDYKIPEPVKNVYAAPVVYKSAPVEYKSAPVVYKSAPVEYKSAPVVYKSAPVVYKSAPVEYKSAPVVHYEAPAQYSQHGDAQSSVSVQSHGVNYHY